MLTNWLIIAKDLKNATAIKNRIDNHFVHKRTLNHLAKPTGWVFAYAQSVCGFESRCCHLNFRYRTCFEQGVPWHSDKYRVQIHSETRASHNNNIQSNKKMILEIESWVLSFWVAIDFNICKYWDFNYSFRMIWNTIVENTILFCVR